MFLVVALLVAVSAAASPRFVSYIDDLTGWWDTSILDAWGVPGYAQENVYTHLLLSFYLSDNVGVDALDPWCNPTEYFSPATMAKIAGKPNPTDAEFREGLVEIYHANGIQIMMSAFGSTDMPTRSHDPVELGEQMANFVQEYQLDGVDIDWEDSPSFNEGTGLGENWLVNLTTTLRKNLPPPYIITHAPQAPYFMGTSQYPSGAYLTVQRDAGTDIDWYNLQFYNQDTSDYATFETLFVESNGWSTNTAVFQMINGTNDMGVKIPSDMIVVGKPATASDADNTGYVSGTNLQSYFQQAISTGMWDAGFMTWEFASDSEQQFSFSDTVAQGF